MEYGKQDSIPVKIDKYVFCELIQEKKEILYRMAYMYVKNEQDALDIVNETIYKAYASLKKLKEPRYFNTWITRISINCVMDYLKKSKRVVPFNESTASQEPQAGAPHEEYIDLYEAVDKLKGNYKTVVILKYFEDLTISEISDIMCCKDSNVKNYLHKALCELRVELKEGEF